MLGALVLATWALLATSGCRKSGKASGPSPAPSDRYADGQKLSASLAAWQKRWQSETTPPSCDALLPEPAEHVLCAEAATALGRVKARADALDKSVEALHDAALLAQSAARASGKLRFRDMEYMGREGIALGNPSATPSARPSPPASAHHTDADAGPDGMRRDDPYQPVLRAYSKLEVEALRYLGVFLEQGPLPLRAAALTEFERLWEEAGRPSHPLQQIVRQASLLESDPAFKERLTKLDAKGHLIPPAKKPN